MVPNIYFFALSPPVRQVVSYVLFNIIHLIFRVVLAVGWTKKEICIYRLEFVNL